jgi:hypothetical protein
VKDLYSDYQQFISVASNSMLLQLLIGWKESKHFPQQNAHANGFLSIT